MSGPFGSDQWMYSSGGYEIDQSLRFNDDDSAYLTRTPASAGNQRTWTWSGWVKRGNIGITNVIFQQRDDYNNSPQFNLQFKSDDTIRIIEQSGGANVGLYDTTAVFRDVSSWYHIVVAFDTTDSTEADRVKLYVNGTRITSFNSPDHWPLNYDSAVNTTVRALIGAQRPNASSTLNNYLDCYLADVHFIDGQALDPSYFGENDADYGHWKPIKYTGSYGTNGFYLDFSNSSSLGEDQSGNSNNWTSNNLAATDVVLDSPTNNFCTLNPLAQRVSATNVFYEGNLKARCGNSNSSEEVVGNFASNQKYYFEALLITTADNVWCGITNTTFTSVSDRTDSIFYQSNGDKRIDNVASAYGATYTSGDIIGIAYDGTAGSVTFYKNGTSQGSISGLTSTIEYRPYVHGKGAFWAANFGQDSSFAGNKTAQGNTDANGIGDFYYAPPSGYLALCTQNLPEPTVAPADHFNTVLYTGDGTSSNAITGVGFQPDFLWIKIRSQAYGHALMDAVRGDAGSWYYQLQSNNTAAESAFDSTWHDYYGSLLSLDTDGFTVANGPSNAIDVFNKSGDSYVAWNWKANGTGVSNTDGTITSTVSANQDAGFSIVSYTGNGSTGQVDSVGHGLSQAPEIYFTKSRGTAQDWYTFSNATGSWQYGFLNGTSAFASTAQYADATEFYLSGTSTNRSGDGFIAYCFHSVDSFSKIGSYTGNLSNDGPFVYTGFRPAFVMVKGADQVVGWIIYDSTRDGPNPVGKELIPNLSAAEADYGDLFDFVSNGFKIKYGATSFNNSGTTYIYMAFAEHPFKYANAR